MKVTQVFEIVNNATKEILGDTTILKEDLSNIVDIGNAIIESDNVDNYVKKINDRICATIFTNKNYSGKLSLLRNNYEYGSIIQKLNIELPEAAENDTWKLNKGTSYDTNIFNPPTVDTTFYNSKVTFEIPMSFTELQIKESFNSAQELTSFISAIYTAIENSMTVKLESLISRTINNMIALTAQNNGKNYINLLSEYNTVFNKSLTKNNAIYDSDFLRFSRYSINVYKDRLTTLSKNFNIGGRATFSNVDDLKLLSLSAFQNAINSYLESDTLHNDFISLNIQSQSIPFWQSADDYSIDKNSTIEVTVKDLSDYSKTKDITVTGILAILYDKNSMGISNFNRRVTTQYNPKGEFFNNWFKMDAGYYNDINENFIVFYMA